MEISRQIKIIADQIKKNEDNINGLVIEKALLGYKPHIDKILAGEIRIPDLITNMIEFLNCQVIDVQPMLMSKVKRSALEVGPNILQWEGIFNPVLYTDQSLYLYME